MTVGDRCRFHPKTWNDFETESLLNGMVGTVQEINGKMTWPIKLLFDGFEDLGLISARATELTLLDPLEQLAEVRL